MHILIFLDQHPRNVNGASLSVELQAKQLEAQGHKVTICAPKVRAYKSEFTILEIPAIPITFDGTHFCFFHPSSRMLRYIEKKLKTQPPVDVVHIQGDFWGGLLGAAYAKKHHLPSVVTYHGDVDQLAEASIGRFFSKVLFFYMSQRIARLLHCKIDGKRTDGWTLLRTIGHHVDVRLAPTAHFVRFLESKGFPMPIGVMSNGFDDDDLNSARQDVSSRPLTPDEPVRIVWCGRLSKEKRILTFIEALAQAKIHAVVDIYGEGQQMAQLKSRIVRHKLGHMINVHGHVPLQQVLKEIAKADVMVQTSVGFESQGRTVFEALCLGVPVIISDPEIAEDFSEKDYWLVDDPSPEALARTLQIAEKDLRHGKKVVSKASQEEFLQSRLTRKVVRIYRSLV